MNGFIGLACVVMILCWLFSGSGSSSRAGRSTAGRSVTVRGHAHLHGGGKKHRASRHEAGHVAGAHGVGGKVHSAQVFSNGGGLVRATLPDERAAITFLVAGQIAHGSSAGAGGDNAAIRSELRRLPSGERSAALRECRKDAKRIVRQRSGEVRRVARKLDQKGTL